MDKSFSILESVIGTYGPLIIEYRHKLYTEKCYKIEQKHVDHIIKKIEDFSFIRISQTSDRSFVLIE
jgi:hypothetical protein|tara:strand:- start:332 stop:532 length:201 start_codon:yes stop_codon:yes gene_type:complete